MMILKPLEIVGVSAVGLILGMLGKKLGKPIAAVAAAYVLGVVIGVKRPKAGWLAAKTY